MVTRRQLFEFNDLSRAPLALRETLLETLGRGLRWGRLLQGLAPHLEDFISQSGCPVLHDVCAGSGYASLGLLQELTKRGQTELRFVLSDLNPHPDIWAELKQYAPKQLEFLSVSVDATAIPEDLASGKARLIVNAFHHFPQALGQSILADAVRARVPIFITEPFERDPLGFVPFIPIAGLGMLLNPLLASQRRLSKMLWSWATPIPYLAGLWDGFVSTLRVYSEGELRAMVQPFGQGYRWTYGHYHYPLGGKGYYFHGIPH